MTKYHATKAKDLEVNFTPVGNLTLAKGAITP
jgi:hypothetical protein